MKVIKKLIKEGVLMNKYNLDKLDTKDRYRMLDRMRGDCEYCISSGNNRHLWVINNPKVHCDLMRELYDSLEDKPDWLSLEDIDRYEKTLLGESFEEGILPDELYNRIDREAKKTYVVSAREDHSYHYEINTALGVYTKVPEGVGFIAHWFLDSRPKDTVEEMEELAQSIIRKYNCKELPLEEYEKVIKQNNESLKESSNGLDELVNRLKSIKWSEDLDIDEEQYGDWVLTAWHSPSSLDFPVGSVIIQIDNDKTGKCIHCGDIESQRELDWKVQKILSKLGVNESLEEDTVKTSDGKWTNKGKEGTHGKFKTKKAADEQRKAMLANGYHENLTVEEDKEAFRQEFGK